MTVPTPRAFERTCDAAAESLAHRLNDLKLLYCGDQDDGGAYHMSLERTVRGSAGKIRHGMSDPTTEIVGDPLDKQRPGAQAALRRALERAPKRIQEAENILSSLEGEIRKAMDRLDPAETFEPLRYPITVTQAELADSQSAQDRRRAGSDGAWARGHKG